MYLSNRVQLVLYQVTHCHGPVLADCIPWGVPLVTGVTGVVTLCHNAKILEMKPHLKISIFTLINEGTNARRVIYTPVYIPDHLSGGWKG